MRGLVIAVIIALGVGIVLGRFVVNDKSSGTLVAPLWLMGTWKSNLEQTKEFNTANVKLDAELSARLDILFGKMEITFKDGLVEFYTPQYSIPIDGEEDLIMEESRRSEEYEVLWYDDHRAALLTKGGDDLYFPVVVTLDDEGSYWLYVAHGLMDIHVREYFSRHP